MNHSLRVVFVFVVALSLITIAGCAPVQPHSGFLKDYPEFGPGRRGGVDQVYMKKGVDFKAYDKIMVDRIVFYFKEDSDAKAIKPDELKHLSNAFDAAMVKVLVAGKYRTVSEPGPGVLRLRFALTDVVASDPQKDAVTTVFPYGLAISLVKKGVTGTHLYVGQASMEVEILDAQTNERLGAAIDTEVGKKYRSFKYGSNKSKAKWMHARDAFAFWAKRLRLWLDEVHGKN